MRNNRDDEGHPSTNREMNLLSRYYNLLKARKPKVQSYKAITYTVSGMSIIFILLFIIFISYYREPLGDDVLSQFTNGGMYYIDGYKGGVGNQINDLPSLYESVKWNYLNWGGRIMGFTLLPLLSLFGHTFTAIITGICFVYLILLAGLLIFNNTKELLKHPLVIILLFLFLYYLNPSINYLLMWTFTSIYIVSLILLGTYYYLFQKYFAFYNISFTNQNIILFNILGFFAGFTHEVFSFTILSLILSLTLKEIIKNKLPIRILFYHTGLLLGTILCISAPGNINRLSQSHDAIRMSQSFIIKLLLVVRTTIYAIIGANKISLFIFAILIAIILIKYTSKNTNNKNILLSFLKGSILAGPFIKNNWIDIFLLFYVIGIWGIFPYMGSYGSILFLFWLSVLIFKNIFIYNPGAIDNLISKYENSLIGLLVVISIVSILCIQNYSWMSSMAKTTIERRIIIENAIKENDRYVNVPLYDDKYSNRFNFYNYNNYKNSENKTEYYIKYYGVYMNPYH